MVAQKEVLEELYKIREGLAKELAKIHGQSQAKQPSEAATVTGVDQTQLQELYKLRDSLNTEIQKSNEKFEAASSKLNFRVDHLKKNLVLLLDENAALKKENEQLKSGK